MLKPTTTQTTTTVDPAIVAARAQQMAEQQKQQQLLIQQQLQQKLLEKYSGLVESKVQAIQDPVKKELMSQMIGISAPPAASSSPFGNQNSGIQLGQSIGQTIFTPGQPTIQQYGTVGTSYRPSSYFPSSSYGGSSASASAGASTNHNAFVPGNTASAYADASDLPRFRLEVRSYAEH